MEARRRENALQKLQLDVIHLEQQFVREFREAQKKFQAKHERILKTRADIASGLTEPTDQESKLGSAEDSHQKSWLGMIIEKLTGTTNADHDDEAVSGQLKHYLETKKHKFLLQFPLKSRQRVLAFEMLQVKSNQLEGEFRRVMYELEKNFTRKHDDIMKKQSDIIAGSYELSEDDCMLPASLEDFLIEFCPALKSAVEDPEVCKSFNGEFTSDSGKNIIASSVDKAEPTLDNAAPCKTRNYIATSSTAASPTKRALKRKSTPPAKSPAVQQKIRRQDPVTRERDRSNDWKSLQQVRLTRGRWYLPVEGSPIVGLTVLSADISQGAVEFLNSVPCLANSIVAVCTENPINWTKSTLHRILRVGFWHYRTIVNDKYDGDMQTELHTDDVENMGEVRIEGRTVRFEVDIIPLEGNGLIPISEGDYSVATIQRGLDRVLQERERAIFIAHGMWQAVLKCADKSIVIFNPHGTDNMGNAFAGDQARAFHVDSSAAAAIILTNGIMKPGWTGIFHVYGVKTFPK